MVFAPLFAGLMLLWPLVAFLGALGTTAILTLAGIAALPFARFTSPPRTYAVLAIAFLAWVAVTWAWSPVNTTPMFTGDIFTNSFAIKAGWLRLVASAAAAILILAALMRVPQGRPRLAAGLVVFVFLLHAAMILPMPAMADVLLDWAYDDPQKALTDGVQNILRNANAFALVLPILVGWAWQFGAAARLGTLGLVIASSVSFALLGGTAAVLAAVLMVASILLVRLLPKRGFKVLFGALGVSILFTPPLLANLARLLSEVGLSLPPSAQSRAWAWADVGNRIMDKPVTGHGLEASGVWYDTYASRPDWLAEIVARGENGEAWAQYPIIPGHPHNMAMEIWVETGLVGAVLLAFAIVALGWRLPAPERMAASLWIATAGLAGAAFALFSFSYSAWNDAFWSGLVLTAGSAILIAKSKPANQLPVK